MPFSTQQNSNTKKKKKKETEGGQGYVTQVTLTGAQIKNRFKTDSLLKTAHSHTFSFFQSMHGYLLSGLILKHRPYV